MPFLSAQFSSVQYLFKCTVQQCSVSFRTFSSCKRETIYPFNNNLFLPTAPGNHHSTFCLCEYD